MVGSQMQPGTTGTVWDKEETKNLSKSYAGLSGSLKYRLLLHSLALADLLVLK
jgi:hypothetical protein